MLNIPAATRIYLASEPVDIRKVALDNNVSERALRIVALLRKNALLVGNGVSGQHLAILLTIVSTCLLHGLEPRRCLADVIVRVNRPGVTVDELLPWNGSWRRRLGGSSQRGFAVARCGWLGVYGQRLPATPKPIPYAARRRTRHLLPLVGALG